jgi:peptidyl-prolyl cis-trans isomerase B (cyclophilin B)
MAASASRWLRAVVGLTGLWTAILLAGCSNHEPAQDSTEPAKNPRAKGSGSSGREQSSLEARLHQPFAEAVLLEPPEGQRRPPDRTKAGKNVPKLYEAVVGHEGAGGLWERVRFLNAAGKRITYTAAIKTDLGNITIELWPDVAPNHVRNFVALAQAGYYDGLEFDRTVKEEIEGDKGKFLQYIEAGCPLGTADPSCSGIGYWMKPELNEQVKHEAGTVGAWHGEEVETAACKFYITVDQAPWMDGNWTVFGKVTQGIDVARAIHARPVGTEKDRPRQPVVIREVAIESKEGEAVAAETQAP